MAHSEVTAAPKFSVFLLWPVRNSAWSPEGPYDPNWKPLVYVPLLLLSGIYNPYEFEPRHSEGSEITHTNAPQSVALLWTSDQPVAETSTWQYTRHSQRTTIYAPGGIRTGNPSRRSAVDTRLRPLGHWDRHWSKSLEFLLHRKHIKWHWRK